MSRHFQLIEVAGEGLKGEQWIPGQKVQFNLGQLKTRTYTPISWNAVEGIVQFVIFLHGSGPGSEWAESLKRETLSHFVGPRSSLNFAELTEDSVFFGDETSIAAAVAPHRSRKAKQKGHYVFEVSSVVETNEVLQRLELPDARIVGKTTDSSHLNEVERALLDGAYDLRTPKWIMTGKAQSIQTLRAKLREERANAGRFMTKAYWAEGKTGLD